MSVLYISRDSIQLAFLLTTLNDLEVLAVDVQDAYLNAPTTEKVYTTAGEEFGADRKGWPISIVQALYGLKIQMVQSHGGNIT
jgi:hypothetical protein